MSKEPQGREAYLVTYSTYRLLERAAKVINNDGIAFNNEWFTGFFGRVKAFELVPLT